MKFGKLAIYSLLVSIIFTAAGSVMAEEKPADNLQATFEKYKSDKKHLVAENMKLSDNEAKTFWPLYERYQSELFLIRMRTVNLIKNYSNSNTSMTDAIASKLLDESLEIETLRLKLSKSYLPKFRKILPATKVVRYYQIESKVNATLYYELSKNIPFIDIEKPATNGDKQ